MSTGADDLRRWDEVAERYAATIGGPADSFYRRLAPFLERHLPAPGGRRILDVGCGHGWLAGVLRDRGDAVLGIDGSAALVERARTDHPDLTFVVHDLTLGLPPAPEPFDAAVAHLVLMDLPEVDALLHDLCRQLRPDGVLVLSILHPSFFHQHPVDGADGERHRRVVGYLRHEQWWIETFGGHRHYHRPLAWYVERLSAAGFVVVGLDEPMTLPPHERPIEQWTDYERWFADLPTMLSIACRPGA